MPDHFRNQATVLADHCLDVERGDTVLIEAPPVAEPLVLSLVAVLGDRGADWHISMISDRIRATYLDAIDGDEISDLASTRAAVEAADGVISIEGAKNNAELGDTASSARASYEEATRPIQQAIMEREWVVTQYPAPGDAQAAGMSTSAYREFVADAVSLDWKAQHSFQQRLADTLDPANEVLVQSGDTDVRFSVDGMCAGNEDGRKNLPGGEVGTAPVPESVTGHIHFDLPIPVQGTTVEDAHVTIDDGEVVEYSAARGEAALDDLFATDDGARRIGEFGIGMNRAISRPTRNILFDEKMGDTVHFAFGFSLPPTVGPNRRGNESAVHQDFLVDMRQEGTIEIDGEVVYRAGAFQWEDGFVA